jgi:hypothetical protein
MFTVRAILAGLLGGLVMAMFEMVYEAIAGAGFWSPVVFIAATLQPDLQGAAVPVAFQPVPVALGLMGHMVNSVILGLVFAWLVAPRMHSVPTMVVAGVVYGLIIFAVQRLVITPLLDPAMLALSPLAFAAAHVMFGATLGLVLGWGLTPARVPATP